MAASQRTLALPLQAPGLVAGVDEAGRGPLAGPVVAAAVILDPRRRIRGIKDSKQLEAQEREALAIKIRGAALSWSVAWADVEEIDCHNILQATHLAMRRALIGLHIHPGHVQVDGNLCPSFAGLPMKCSYEAIIDGDALRTCIGAASILAKVTRDRMMVELDALYPEYGFASHKGYSTPQHYKALQRHGPTPIHRRSFEPVRLAGERRLSLADMGEMSSDDERDPSLVTTGKRSAVEPSVECQIDSQVECQVDSRVEAPIDY